MRLPPGWGETTDARGRKYFYNATTQESSWTPPPGTIEDPPAAPAGPPRLPGGPPPPPMRAGGPPPMPGGPPAFGTNPSGSGPPAFGTGTSLPRPAGGPPPIPSGGLPPIPGSGPPALSLTSSNSTQPPPSPMNRGPPPLITPTNGGGNLPPPSPMNRGPPPMNTGPPPMAVAPPTSHFSSGSPFAATVTTTTVPLTRPPAPSVAGPPPMSRPPGASISGPPPMMMGVPPMPGSAPPPPMTRPPAPSVAGPPPMTRPPGASISGPPPMIMGMLPPGAPLTRPPGASVSGPPPMTRPPGASVSGPPPMMMMGGPPTRIPTGSIGGPPRPPTLTIGEGPPPSGTPLIGTPLNLTPIPSAPNSPANNLSPGPLPYPWKETTSPNGKVYYYNTITNESSWVYPTSAANSSLMSTGSMVGDLKHLPMSPDAPRRFQKEFSHAISQRTGVFKSWQPMYLTVRSQSQLVVYENDTMKKDKVKCAINHLLVIPTNRGDGRNVIMVYEFKTAPAMEQDVKQAKNTYYFDCGTNDIRDELLVVLHDQGAMIRRPIWEAQAVVNKEPRFVAVYQHQLEIYKKSIDDDQDITLTYAPATFFQSVPSTFPLLYEDKVYGAVTETTFVLADKGDEDATLYYITMLNNTNPNTPPSKDYKELIKDLRDVIEEKQTKVDPASLCEGYLYKASTNLQRWARRYFILRRDSLSYYKARGDDKPAGECALPNGFEIDLNRSGAQHPHPLFVAESGDEGTRQYLMCALNEPDYNSWSSALSTLQQQKQVKKDPNSIKEGYLLLCGHKQAPHRKYVLVGDGNLRIYNSRNDHQAALTVQLPKGCFISDASLPDGDMDGQVRLSILGITNPQTSAETFFGFTQPKEREEWSAVLKQIAGDAVAKSHPESYREGYMYKSKKKGSLGSLKYVVVTPHALYYSDKKEADVLSSDPAIAKRIKKFEHTGDAPLDDDHTSIPGYKGIVVPSTGDEGGGEVCCLYFGDENEFQLTRNALTSAMSSVDWRRDKTSIFEGYIWKSAANGKSWTYRYAILTADALSFYKRKLDKELAGQMPLQGCQYNTVSFVNDTAASKEDRNAVEHFASLFKAKPTFGNDMVVIGVQPPTNDPKAKKIWIGNFAPAHSLQWSEVLGEMSSVGKQQHMGSIKEGYMCFGGSGAANRKYIALFKNYINLYPSRLDSTLQQSLPLSVGFDVLYKDNTLYISKDDSANETLRGYYEFTNAVGGEVLSSWLAAFQEAFDQNTPAPSQRVRATMYMNISFNKEPQAFKYVVLLNDRLSIYKSRSQCFTSPQATEPDLRNAERTAQYIQTALEVSELGPQKIQLKIYNETYTLDFRTDYEKHSFYTIINSSPTPAINVGGGSTPPINKQWSRQSTIAMASPRSTGFTFSLPSAPKIDEGFTPPPPMFLEEDEDPPPPPPPEFDDEPAPPPPDFTPQSTTRSFFPPTATAAPAMSTPVVSSVPETKPLPVFDDLEDDDDIPDFIKEKRRQQAAAAAAAAAPAPAATSGFKAPVRNDTSSSTGGFGLNFDFDLPPEPTFDLPPPAGDDLAPPAATSSASRFGISEPTSSSVTLPEPTSSGGVRRPLFGANRSATSTAAATPAPAVNPKYQPVDFDDDDDLPPPGGK